MTRRSSTVCLAILAGLSLAWALTAAVARAADEDRKASSGENTLLTSDMVTKFRNDINDNGIKPARDDIKSGGADVEDAHNDALRFAAEKELMRDPDIKARVEELAKESSLQNMHNDDAKKVTQMLNDGKTRRRMLMEMAVRQSCKEHAMPEGAKTASEKQ